MTSLKEDLARWLARSGQWEPKGLLTDTLKWTYVEKGVTKQYLAETCGRKLRELESESRIAVKDLGASICYKFLPPERRNSYIPWSSRPDGKKDILFKS